MATSITLTMDASAAIAGLDRFVYLVEHPNVMLAEWGENLLEWHQQRINSDKSSPDGVPWPAVTDDYAASKREGKATSEPGDARTSDPKDLLRLTHRLVDNLFYQVGTSELVFGSPEPYAAALHFGRPSNNLKPRPWLGLSEAQSQDIERITVGHIADCFPSNR